MSDPSKHRRLPLLLLAVALVMVSACSDTATQNPGGATLSVTALVGGADAGRLEPGVRAGLERMDRELGATTNLLRVSDTTAQRRFLRELGRRQVDLVFCFGPDFSTPVYSEARAYPDTRFVLLSGAANGLNVAGLQIEVEEAGFVAGSLASLFVRGQGAGAIISGTNPWFEQMQSGFLEGLGLIAEMQELVVVSETTGPWELARLGIDAALYCTEHADPAVLAAAHDAGVWLVVTDPQALQWEDDVVLGVITIDLAEAMMRVAKEAITGSFSSRVYSFGLGSAVVDLKLSPELAADPTVRDLVAAFRSEVNRGWVEIEYELGL